MSRLRLTLIAVAIAALVAPGTGLARFEAAAGPTVAKTVQISLPDIGDVTFARITYTAAKRQAKNPKLTVANGDSLDEAVRVLASIRPLNSQRRTFEALVLVVSPARGLPARVARPAGGGPVVVLRANAKGKLKAKLDEAVDVFGTGILEFTCDGFEFAHALTQLFGDEIPDVDETGLGKGLCTNDPVDVSFVRGPLPAEGAAGDDHLGPGSSLAIGSLTTAAGALVVWSSSVEPGQQSYRALRLFGEDDFQSDPLSTACLNVPISTFGTKSFTWQVSLYGQTATVTKSINVNATEFRLPECVNSGAARVDQAWGCFGSSGGGYIGKTIKGTPGSRVSIELTSPVADMFYGTDTARVTGTIPADGELYTGTAVESRGLINVRLFDGGTSSVTMTVDTSEDLPPAPEEAKPVCDVM